MAVQQQWSDWFIVPFNIPARTPSQVSDRERADSSRSPTCPPVPSIFLPIEALTTTPTYSTAKKIASRHCKE